MSLLRESDSNRRICRAFLSRALPDETFLLDPSTRETKIDDIAKIIRDTARRTTTASPPALSTDDKPCQMDYRCGRPYESSHLQDKWHIFLNNIVGEDHASTMQYPTSFAFKRDMVRSFFGLHRSARGSQTESDETTGASSRTETSDNAIAPQTEVHYSRSRRDTPTCSSPPKSQQPGIHPHLGPSVVGCHCHALLHFSYRLCLHTRDFRGPGSS